MLSKVWKSLQAPELFLNIKIVTLITSTDNNSFRACKYSWKQNSGKNTGQITTTEIFTKHKASDNFQLSTRKDSSQIEMFDSVLIKS